MKEEIIRVLKKVFKKLGIRETYLNKLEKPPNENLGDFSFPCFSLSPLMKKNPEEIASRIGKKIKEVLSKEKGIIERVEVVDGYVNFFLNKKEIAKKILNGILEKKEWFSKKKEGEKIMVEYEAPNTNKPLHLGHLRNAALGISISRILEFCGDKVIKANLFNDRGIHICQAMVAYKKFYNGKKPNKKSDHFVGDLYVKFHEEVKKNPHLQQEAEEMLRKFENRDKEVVKLWKKINEWAINGIEKTNKIFGAEFDICFKESDFYKKANKIINEGIKKRVFVKDKEGNIIAKLEPELPDKVVLRKDGTSIYITNDLVLTPYKFSRYKLDSSLWIVASEQNLYFKQLFKIFEKLGYKWFNKCKHISYGLVFLPEGRMKSREGKVVDADEFIENMRIAAEKELKKRYKLKDKELKERSLKIALSAIKYFFLKIDRMKDIYFNTKEALSFEGNSGPYLQYSYARACSILRKSKARCGEINKIESLNEYEERIIKKFAEFPEIIKQTHKSLNPYIIANYSFELCKLFNEFYNFCPVINAKERKKVRIAIVKTFIIILKNCLYLLGIDPLEEM